MEQLIAQLQQNTASNRQLADSVALLAGAVHALADSLAACTTEPAPAAAPEPTAQDGVAPAGAEPYAYIGE